jgi:uncharacterized membrane protein YdfJ with MMPL/SSD domain
MLGLGLAVSVLIDATVVRLLLVPAAMTLLGRAACGRRGGWTGSCRLWTPRACHETAAAPRAGVG